MEIILLFLLCFTFIVFWGYLLKHIKFALELTKIYENWLTHKMILSREGCSPTVRRTEAHYEPKTKQSSKTSTTLVPLDSKTE